MQRERTIRAGDLYDVRVRVTTGEERFDGAYQVVAVDNLQEKDNVHFYRSTLCVARFVGRSVQVGSRVRFCDSRYQSRCGTVVQILGNEAWIDCDPKGMHDCYTARLAEVTLIEDGCT